MKMSVKIKKFLMKYDILIVEILKSNNSEYLKYKIRVRVFKFLLNISSKERSLNYLT